MFNDQKRRSKTIYIIYININLKQKIDVNRFKLDLSVRLYVRKNNKPTKKNIKNYIENQKTKKKHKNRNISVFSFLLTKYAYAL